MRRGLSSNSQSWKNLRNRRLRQEAQTVLLALCDHRGLKRVVSPRDRAAELRELRLPCIARIGQLGEALAHDRSEHSLPISPSVQIAQSVDAVALAAGHLDDAEPRLRRPDVQDR